jgi:hypothetical protein
MEEKMRIVNGYVIEEVSVSCDLYKIGDRVSFRGHTGKNGQMLSVCADGPATFEATVTSKPYGICYSLTWDDGEPVGLPFHDFQLTKVCDANHGRD